MERSTTSDWPRSSKISSRTTGLPEFTFARAHFSHESDETRTEQAQQINTLFRSQAASPILVAGDLNARPGSKPITTLLNERWSDAIAPKSRIDYVLYGKDEPWKVVDLQIIDDRIASDHRPVFVILEWQGDGPGRDSDRRDKDSKDPAAEGSASPQDGRG